MSIFVETLEISRGLENPYIRKEIKQKPLLISVEGVCPLSRAKLVASIQYYFRQNSLNLVTTQDPIAEGSGQVILDCIKKLKSTGSLTEKSKMMLLNTARQALLAEVVAPSIGISKRSVTEQEKKSSVIIDSYFLNAISHHKAVVNMEEKLLRDLMVESVRYNGHSYAPDLSIMIEEDADVCFENEKKLAEKYGAPLDSDRDLSYYQKLTQFLSEYSWQVAFPVMIIKNSLDNTANERRVLGAITALVITRAMPEPSDFSFMDYVMQSK